MRMRKKPNLVPRMERCAATLITDPEALRGRWLEQFPGYQALQLELGCGKGRFTADTAAQNPDIFLAAIEKVPDAMVVGMERVTERGLENVRFLDRDAANLLDMFAPGEVSRIYINFPDPWKKSRQHKRRLTYAGFLALYANCRSAARSGSRPTTTRCSPSHSSSSSRKAGSCARSRTICTPTALSAS